MVKESIYATFTEYSSKRAIRLNNDLCKNVQDKDRFSVCDK